MRPRNSVFSLPVSIVAALGEGDELSMLVFFKSGLNSFLLLWGLDKLFGIGIFHLLVEYYKLKNKGDIPQARSRWR